MTLDQLRYFVEAARFQHIGQAAKSIAISPSAISGAISSLEDELGQPLFERKAKRIILTVRGQQLKGRAERILGEIAALPHELVDGQKLQGTYKLGAGHFLSSRLLGPAWWRLQEKHPDLKGELFSMNPGTLVAEILSGKLNIGVCISPQRHADLEENRIHEGELLIVVKKDHPLTRKAKAKQLEVVSDYPASVHRSSHGLNTCENHPVLKEFNIFPKADFFYDNDEVAVNKLLQTESWSLMPDFVVKTYAEQLYEIPKPKEWNAKYRLSIIKHKFHEKDEALLQLSRELIQGLKKFLS